MQGALDPRALTTLGTHLRGTLIRPGDASYESQRRVWNGSIDRYPASIARCTDAADVATALRFARTHGLLVAVRGGGHSFPGHSVCDDGMVIDLSLMKGIRVDPDARTARVQAGVLLGELDQATQAYVLAVPAGIVTHTGVAGLTLGGGIGWIMRKYGLTVDNLLSVDMVTADGESVTVSATENADLFWGVRGGGGNFGIVTNFEFRLHPLGPDVFAGPVFWPMEEAAKVLRFYRDWVADCPDELMTIVVQRRVLDLPGVPRDLVGRHVIAVTACYAGPVEDGERVVRPLKSFGRPLLDLCQPKPYLVHQSMFDPGYPPRVVVLRPGLRRRRAQRRCDRYHCRARSADRVTDLEHRAVADGGSGRPGRRGRDLLLWSQRRVYVQHQRQQIYGGGLRRRTRVGAGVLVGARPVPIQRVRELSDGRGRGTGPAGVRAGEIRPAEGAQAQTRPGQCVPPQPEHPARLGASEYRPHRCGDQSL